MYPGIYRFEGNVPDRLVGDVHRAIGGGERRA